MERGIRPIGDAIKLYRKKNKMSIDILADRSGVSKNTVKRAERGESIRWNNLLDIANALNAHYIVLTGGEVHPSCQVVLDFDSSYVAKNKQALLALYHEDCRTFLPNLTGVPYTGEKIVGKEQLAEHFQVVFDSILFCQQRFNLTATPSGDTVLVLADGYTDMQLVSGWIGGHYLVRFTIKSEKILDVQAMWTGVVPTPGPIRFEDIPHKGMHESGTVLLKGRAYDKFVKTLKEDSES
ncbi:MAG: helix-turn-helix transcriptional regulator [Planctomycetales bacterium]|nr:helix-turn-helix transcriptional regulator [Planctomycetales bacterium]